MRRLSPEEWARIDALCAAALEAPAEDRDAILVRGAGGDVALLREAQALLRSCEDAGKELPDSATAFASALVSELRREPEPESGGLAPGDRVGPYRIRQEIGRGGMGAVYLAERADEQFDKQVALKVVKRGMDTDEVLRRFRAERQILAALEHPNIARLYDGGATDDGRPYLVLEYVDGAPIDAHCDTHGLGLAQRLDLFTTVCAAVQYAHRNLVVHRDLKPSNVLVSTAGEVKLLDFGIAKLLDPASDELTPETRTGLRVLTPDYAAPEQLRGDPATTAADVWALGVILHRLLTGRKPTKGPPGEMARPSDAAPPEWRRRLRGDLDTIVRKALEPEPARRYASAQHLLEDLERHRTGLPILARPPGLAYRAGKYARRHRAGVTAAAAALLAVTVSSAGWGVRVTRERDTALAERAVAEHVAGFLTDLFASSDPFAPGPERRDTLRARDLARLGTGRLRADREMDPAIRARMLVVLGKVNQELGLHDEAEELLREAVDLRRGLHTRPHPELAEAVGQLVSLLHTRGHFADAEPLAREALALRRAIHEPQDPAIARAIHDLARLLMVSRALEEAESLQHEAVAIQRRALDRTDPELADGVTVLARIMMGQRRDEEAEHLLRESLTLRREAHGDAHPLTAVGLIDLGFVLRRLGRLEEAADALLEADAINRAALGHRHPHLVHNLNVLAFVRNAQGDTEEAARLLERSIDIQLDYGDGPPLSVAWDAYAGVLEARGDIAGGERARREALAVARRVHGDEHWEVALLTVRLGRHVRANVGPAQALPLFREGLAVFERTRPPDDVERAMARMDVGSALRELGRFEEAEPHLRGAYDVITGRLGAEHAFAGRARQALLALYEASGRPADAVALTAGETGSPGH
jgi:eukaryotic-like serine/threonine-protein kinase